MPTLKDVAKKANVSVTTASYAINGVQLITKETTEKVLLAAKQIGYRPNGNAKNLKKNKSEIIGFFLSGFTGPFFNEMLEGIQTVIIQSGYEMVVCASDDKHRLLVEHYVDGAIVLNYHLSDELLNTLASDKMPMITLDREVEHPFIKNVLLQNKEGIDLAVKHLIEKGHQRIGFLGGSEDSYDGEKRLEGYRESLQKYGLKINEKDTLRATFTEISGLIAMEAFINENKGDIPSAFICANDEMAMGAMKAMKKAGLRVPEDVAVVGFDDISIAQYSDPPLSTIRVEKKQWGEYAAEILFKMMHKEYDFEPQEMPVQFIHRASS